MTSAWIAALPPQKDGTPLRIELRFGVERNKQGGTSTHLARGRQASPYTSGMYAWNAAKKNLISSTRIRAAV